MANSSTVASIDVVLKGQTAELQKALQKGQSQVSGFAKSIESIGGGNLLGGLSGGLTSFLSLVNPVTAALAAIAAGFALISFSAHQGTENILEVSKAAARLGTTTEAMAGLQVGAVKAGMDIETLTHNLTHLEKNLSNAAGGTGEAAEALKKMGLSAQDLLAADTTTQLEKLADGMKGLGNQSDKIAVSMKLFGREGASMLAIMKDGSEGIQGLAKEAERLGLSFNADQAAQVKAGAVAWREMKLAITGIGNTFAIALAPAIKKAGDIATSFFVGVNQFIQGAIPWVEAFFELWKSYWSLLGDIGKAVLDFLIAPFKDLFSEFPSWSEIWHTFRNNFLGGIYAMTFAMDHWKDALKLGMTEAQFFIEVFKNHWEELFTKSLPAALEASADYLKSYFSHLVENAGDAMERVKERIRGDFSKDFEWKGLTGDFDKITEDLKKKAAIPLTDLEKGLLKSIQQQGGDLLKGMQDFVNKKLAELDAGSKRSADIGRGVSDTGMGNTFKGLERGSLDEYKLLIGEQGDKTFAVQNQLLQENKAMRMILEKIYGQPKTGLKLARL